MQKQTAALLVKGGNSNIKALCNSQLGRKKALRMSRCLTRLGEEFRSIVDDMANDYRFVRREQDVKAKMALTCCAYHRFNARLTDKATSRCHRSGVEGIKTFLETISGDIMNLLCSSYTPEMPQCIEFASRVTSAKFTPSDHTSSFIPPLLILIDDF